MWLLFFFLFFFLFIIIDALFLLSTVMANTDNLLLSVDFLIVEAIVN